MKNEEYIMALVFVLLFDSSCSRLTVLEIFVRSVHAVCNHGPEASAGPDAGFG